MTQQNLVLTEKAIGRHIKRLQKELSNIQHQIKLSEAQNMFSRILGMKDFYELKKVLQLENSLEESVVIPIKNPFQEDKIFDLAMFDRILDFLIENKLDFLTIDESNGIYLFFEENLFLKIQPIILKATLFELAEKLYGEKHICAEINQQFNAIDFIYQYYKDNLKQRFRVNISPFLHEFKHSFSITIKPINQKITPWKSFQSSIDPFSYKKGFNLILSKNGWINQKVQASMMEQIIKKSNFMKICSLSNNGEYDFVAINEKI